MAEIQREKFRVLVLDDYEGLASGVPAFEKLKERAEVTVLKDRLETDEELAQALQGIDAIVLMRERTRFGEKQLSLAPSLKFISQTAHGIAHLDLPAATRRGIAVAPTPNDSGISTIELTFGLILALLRRISQIDRRMRQETWPAIPGQLLEGKTMGIIGLGRIGKGVARIAQAFRVRVLATGKSLTEERAQEVGTTRVSLDRLLRESDIVTLHLRLNGETRGLIGEKNISLMKPGAILINTSRGPVISESALVNALERGHLAGVGLDVYDEEPLPFKHPLRRFDNVVLLPHRGYSTIEVLSERFEQAMTNILNFMDGKMTNLLNPEVLTKKDK
ncbi:MAG: D-2-hydroxyacid dehydrogenase family protein [Candidatus Binatia bacterium]